MQVHVRLAETLGLIAGQRRLTVTLAEGAVLADLLASLVGSYPGLRAYLALPPRGELADYVTALIGSQEAGLAQALADGEEVWLLMPISGG